MSLRQRARKIGSRHSAGRSQDAYRPTGPYLHQHPWLLAVPLALIVVIVVLDMVTPADLSLTPFLTVAPAVTAFFAGARLTFGIGLIAVAAELLTDLSEKPPTPHESIAPIAIIAVSVFVTVYAHLRDRYSQRCHRAQSIALIAQKAVLRPLPNRMGQLEIASEYLAAESEAVMGGDLYAAARTSTSTRLLIGDVRGKGLGAVEEAALVMGAFRGTAHQTADLRDLATTLDGALIHEPNLDHREHDGEEFVTALLLDIPDGAGPMRVISCGHPAPVVLRNGRTRPTFLPDAAPPLGLGLAAHYGHIGVIPWAIDDIVLLCTDGVLEARDRRGQFYPILDRVESWPGSGPRSLVSFLRDDLLRFADGSLNDDAALVAFRHSK